MYVPVFEKAARPPCQVERSDRETRPPRPFEPTGCRSAAGYCVGLPFEKSFPPAATRRTSLLAAYSIARRSVAEALVPPKLRLMIFAPWSTA